MPRFSAARGRDRAINRGMNSNTAVEPTASSVRSYLAPASGGGSPRALGVISLPCEKGTFMKKRKGKSDVDFHPLSAELLEQHFPRGFTIRDEANALTAFAFRNGPLEDLHAGRSPPLTDDPSLSRITDAEMKHLMITASEKLASMLTLEKRDPEKYKSII